MKFGGFYELQLPRPWTPDSEHKVLKDSLDQVELADRLGFDYIWATEHHFLEEYAHSSAPEVFLAACTQRTKTARIGHGIIQMPPNINHPARVAERVSTLDLISNGRVDYGIGAGASETELGGFGVPQAEKKQMMLEGARAVIEMMTQTPFPGIDGKYFKMPARNVVPKPYQKPHPPLWMACSNRASILQAARLGVGALTFSFIGPEEARKWVEDYHTTFEKEAEPLGYAVNPNFAIACPFLCDNNEERVQALGAEIFGFFIYGLGHYSFFGEHEPGRTDIWDEFKNNPKNFAPPEGRTQDCVGTPQRLREQLREFEAVGIDQVICLSQAGGVSHDQLCSSIELFSQEVLPEFKEREIKSLPKQAERLARLTEIAMPRRPKAEAPAAPTIIRAAGHH
ncbi:MAG TPA: LLM class flavin-dependent oxidoreductase [Bryobacteraceae bacterium]|jgi:alkanesulfonate monooxygenase SsuD/methylene tetrahydromethanopterin reductase-like flavin-dependent oxidoreductase (luciferase family)